MRPTTMNEGEQASVPDIARQEEHGVDGRDNESIDLTDYTADATHPESRDQPTSQTSDDIQGIVEDNGGPSDSQHSFQSHEAPAVHSPEVVQLYLNTTQLVLAQLLGIIDELPTISEEEISDKSQINLPLRLFAMVKLIHFLYVIVRLLSGNHSLVLLEIATVSYVLCALFTYALYWSKPQGIEVPVILDLTAARHVTIREATHWDLRVLNIAGGTGFIKRNFKPPFGANQVHRQSTERISSDVSVSVFVVFETARSFLFDADFAGIVAGIAVGSLHCLAWAHDFSSSFEAAAWRSASTIITASLISYAAANAAFTLKFHDTKTHTHASQILTLYFLLFLYIACRVYLLLAMFREAIIQRSG